MKGSKVYRQRTGWGALDPINVMLTYLNMCSLGYLAAQNKFCLKPKKKKKKKWLEVSTLIILLTWSYLQHAPVFHTQPCLFSLIDSFSFSITYYWVYSKPISTLFGALPKNLNQVSYFWREVLLLDDYIIRKTKKVSMSY